MIRPVIWTSSCGSYTLYAIEDAWTRRTVAERFPGTDPTFWAERPEYLVNGALRVSIGCFLLTDSVQAILVDTGTGPDADPPGLLPEALAFAGVDPSDVGLIIHTSLDADHCGGDLRSDGTAAFPGARVAVHRRELTERAGEDRVIRLRAGLGDAVTPFDGAAELAPGVSTTETPGHSPGHVTVTVASRGSRLVIAGDALHHPAQVEHPSWSGPDDADPESAARSRTAFLEQVAGTGAVIAAAHFPAPGIGYVERVGASRFFSPGICFQVA